MVDEKGNHGTSLVFSLPALRRAADSPLSRDDPPKNLAMTESEAINALKALIPRAWHAFLARFGTPTPIQRNGIPAIMEGSPTLLIAPTSSGKTEAFAAPMAEMILADPALRDLSGLPGWIVSPTRALVNDLVRRLAPPLSAMGLRVGRRTGEHREISGLRPPHIVVTTPESLDSILARSPSIVLPARFLVLDEVHMLDATPRGDQLACLVSRMRSITPRLQVIASSATVDDPYGLAGRYLREQAKPYRFCPSVLVQQCISLLMQAPGKWIAPKALASRMPGWLGRTGWTSDLKGLFDHLVHEKWLIAGSGRYHAGEKLEEAFEAGIMHTNIEDSSGEMEVVDQETRRVLGTLPRIATEDGRLLLGGRKLRVSKALSRSQVLVTDTRERAELKVGAIRGPVIHANLARDFARFMGFDPDEAPILPLEDGTVALFHFLGSLWGVLLGVLVQECTGKKPMGANAFCLILENLPDRLPWDMPHEEIRAMAIRHRFKLRSKILEGPWAKLIPSEWRHRHLTACLDIEGFTKTLERMVMKQVNPSSDRRNDLSHIAGWSSPHSR
jgi:hypothetical protein